MEVTILSIPEEINEHRDMGKNYNILEAHEIIRRQQLIRFPLQFSEELPYADGVFTYEGREKLFTKLCALGAERFVAIYTSDPFVLTIGCYKGKPFMIDTHLVAPPIRDGNGLLCFLLFTYLKFFFFHAPQLQNERLEEANHTAKENQIKVAQYSFQHFPRRRL